MPKVNDLRHVKSSRNRLSHNWTCGGRKKGIKDRMWHQMRVRVAL